MQIKLDCIKNAKIIQCIIHLVYRKISTNNDNEHCEPHYNEKCNWHHTIVHMACHIYHNCRWNCCASIDRSSNSAITKSSALFKHQKPREFIYLYIISDAQCRPHIGHLVKFDWKCRTHFGEYKHLMGSSAIILSGQI